MQKTAEERKEAAKEYQRQWRKANRERVRGYETKYRQANLEKYAQHARNWRKANAERSKELDAAKYQAGKARNLPSKMLAGARDRAKILNLPFDLSKDDIVIPTHCPVLGLELKSGNNDTRPELDRIIPSLGYVKDNVCVISGRANRIKWNATYDELMALASYVKSKAKP